MERAEIVLTAQFICLFVFDCYKGESGLAELTFRVALFKLTSNIGFVFIMEN